MNKSLMIAFSLILFACNTTPNNQGHQAPDEKDKIDSASQHVADNSLKFDTYCNARYGYCIDYPTGLIYPQPESYNGDGRVFKNKQGDEVLTVFGRMNASPEGGTISLEQQFDDDLHGFNEENGNKDRVITYQKLGKTFFVISGYKKGRVFYQKTILKDDSFAYAIFEYSESDKVIFDKVSERIFKSFK